LLFQKRQKVKMILNQRILVREQDRLNDELEVNAILRHEFLVWLKY